MAERARGHWSWGDIVRSMAVLVVPALLIAWWAEARRGDQDGPRSVAYEAELASARERAAYDVVAPVGLDDGWTATSVRITPVGDDGLWWHLGFLSPEDTYVGLEQSDDDRDDLLDELFEGTREDGTTTVAGEPWDRLVETGDDDDPDEALVRTVDGVTTVVHGIGGYAALEGFAATLQGS